MQFWGLFEARGWCQRGVKVRQGSDATMIQMSSVDHYQRRSHICDFYTHLTKKLTYGVLFSMEFHMERRWMSYSSASPDSGGNWFSPSRLCCRIPAPHPDHSRMGNGVDYSDPESSD